MTLDYANRHVLTAALALLPARMDTPEARALLLAIALQESRFVHRHQINGPARGFFMFEKAGVSGVLNHPASATYARDMSRSLCYEPAVTTIYDAIADNDILACCFARLLLWTLPDALPGRDDVQRGWAQYLAAWRPGRPRIETWSNCWARAWAVVDQSTVERMTGTVS